MDSLSKATGAEFSLIAAQNAAGNWVRVVQRVRLRIPPDRAAGQLRLRAGLQKLDAEVGRQAVSWPGCWTSGS